MNEPDDESISFFLEGNGFGPAIDCQPVPQNKIEKFRGKLPEQLLFYWQKYGWCGYGKGLIWLVDPDLYEPVLDAWIGDLPIAEQDAYYVIARSAFGQLFLWGTKTGPSIKISSQWGTIFPSDNAEYIRQGKGDFLVRMFFETLDKGALDEEDELESPLFARACKSLGILNATDTYAFVPALALGGEARLGNLQRVNAVENIVLLAQLGERQVMDDIVKVTKAMGGSPPKI